jgi:hypothetical protein
MMNMSEKNKQVFLDGLRKYQKRGIPVLIDGKRADSDSLEKIFEQDDQGFYMGDYVLEEAGKPDNRDLPTFPSSSVVYESYRNYIADLNTRRFHLKEIHFDKVYHR